MPTFFFLRTLTAPLSEASHRVDAFDLRRNRTVHLRDRTSQYSVPRLRARSELLSITFGRPLCEDRAWTLLTKAHVQWYTVAEEMNLAGSP